VASDELTTGVLDMLTAVFSSFIMRLMRLPRVLTALDNVLTVEEFDFKDDLPDSSLSVLIEFFLSVKKIKLIFLKLKHAFFHCCGRYIININKQLFQAD
jgi:hypothetical protein